MKTTNLLKRCTIEPELYQEKNESWKGTGIKISYIDYLSYVNPITKWPDWETEVQPHKSGERTRSITRDVVTTSRVNDVAWNPQQRGGDNCMMKPRSSISCVSVTLPWRSVRENTDLWSTQPCQPSSAQDP